MSEDEKFKKVESFIFNDEVQDALSDINNILMDFNILEITGMGHQEIKHSNILGWLFDDSEHNLEYLILDNFLKKVIEENADLKHLEEYIYLPDKKRDITIYREEENIDLLIVDKNNKVVIAIENKIYAEESTEKKSCGDFEEKFGQLECYEKKVKNRYPGWEPYFIFLTKDLEKPSREIWAKANYTMVSDVIESVLELKKVNTKTKIILESYVDLLQRIRIVPNKKIQELCEKIWNNDKEEYREALEILFEYRPNKLNKLEGILNELEKNNEIYVINKEVNSGAYSFHIKVNKNSSFVYKLWYSTGQRKIKCRIVIAKNIQNIDLYRDKIKKSDFTEASDGQFEYYNLTADINDWQCEEEDIKELKIKELIQKFKNADEKLNTN